MHAALLTMFLSTGMQFATDPTCSVVYALAHEPAAAAAPVDLMPASIEFAAIHPSIKLAMPAVAVQGGANYSFTWDYDPGAVEYNFYTGSQDGVYTNAIGISDPNVTSIVVSNVVSRAWFTISAISLYGDEVFGDEIMWPPWTNIVIVTDPVDLETAGSVYGPWMDAQTNYLSYTNPVPVAGFFRGNNPGIRRILR